MTRIISLVVLVAILLVIAALFFKVMAGFLLPVFLAMLLVVMFGPVHRWFLVRCRGRTRLAAVLTTAAILLSVLLPLIAILFQAVHDSASIYHRLNLREVDIRQIIEPIVRLGRQVGLEISAEQLQSTVMGSLREWLAPMALGAPSSSASSSSTCW